MNPTITKFGWPHTLVREWDHWLALVRPAQPTLASLVLAAKSDATAFGDLPLAAHAELKQVTGAIEAALAQAVAYEKINYLMLMMVDAEVHFHVIPRYSGTREWQGREFVDVGWPRLPELVQSVVLTSAEITLLATELSARFR